MRTVVEQSLKASLALSGLAETFSALSSHSLVSATNVLPLSIA